ncbi:MAG: acyl-CoA dehydrogenase family protein [Deltaproteobacteria bacterium]|jgi:alkylation response protein AidB-like acyl-CoA dehydrogenase|nr:acyl-CoA dehydrogenase family protein [Deltaproteobacteria bacterium]
MSYQLSKSQKEIQKAARDFAKGEFDKELAYELDKNQEFPEKIWQKAAELGFIGMHFPEKYSGGEMDWLDNVLLAEEFCRKDSTLGCAVMLSAAASECILRFGSDELKDKFLPQVAEGEMLSGAAFLEPDADPAFANLNTVAAKEGDTWVINGEKSFVLNGSMAGFYCVLCRTRQDDQETASVFLVEANQPGISVVDSGEKLGLRMTKTTGLKFENVNVPSNQLIGKEGNGFKQAQATLDEGRLLIASLALGTAQGAFDRALDYTKQREQFGKKIIKFQVTQHKLAEMATKIEQARFFVYGAAQTVVRGKVDTRYACMAKMVATRIAVEVTSEAIQLLGGYGYMTEYEIERFYRDAKSMELLGGSPGHLKDLIAKSVVGRIK